MRGYKFKKPDVIFLLLSTFLVFLTYHSWFFSTLILTFGDWGYYLPETQKEFLRFPYLWNSAGMGFVDIGLTIYPIAILYWGVLAQFFNYEIVSRITYFFPSVLFGVYGSYLLNRKIGLSPFGSFVGMLVFNFNTYILLGRTGHLTLMTAFGITPWILYFFIQTLEKKKIYLSIITGLFACLTSFYEVRAFYIVFFILFAYLCFFIYSKKYYSSVKKITSYVLYSLPGFTVYLLVNLFWFVGISQAGGIEESGVVGRALFGEGYMSIIRAITLFHPFWSYSRELIFTAQPVPLYFWLIPLFALLGLIINRKKPIVLFFGFLAVFGVFLTKQSSQPFPDVYKWLYDHFPGFNAFRESTKFYFVTALGYSVLIGSFVDSIQRFKGFRLHKFFIYYVIIALFVVNTKPFITTEIGKLFTGRDISPDYITLNNLINSQPGFFRTLWIPRDSRWGTWGNQHPKLSSIDQVQTNWKKLNEYNKQGKDFTAGEQITSIFMKSFSNNILDRAGVKYVIIPTLDLQNEDDFIKYYGPRDYFIQKIGQLTYLKKVDIGTKELLVYENEKPQPLFYSGIVEDSIETNPDFQKVDSQFINATSYIIKVNNLKTKTYLYFGETFHPGWGIKLGEQSSLPMKLENYMDEHDHLSTIDNLNLFVLDPGIIRKKFDKTVYSQNDDGSISFTATVFFKPQAKLNQAALISSISLTISILLFGILYKKNL